MVIDKSKKEILEKVEKLYRMWRNGELGGEVMPEDANPGLDKSSLENYLYFTYLWHLIIKEILIFYGKVL